MMKYLKIYSRLLVSLTSFTVFFSGDIKEKSSEEKRSENDQSTGHFHDQSTGHFHDQPTGHFQSFFFPFFSSSGP